MVLTKILRKFKNLFLCLKKYFELKKISSKKAVMFNTPAHSNLGDQALSLGEKIFFQKNFPNLVYTEVTGTELNGLFKLNLLKNIVHEHDIICVHAGGFLGTLWIVEEKKLQQILKTFKNRKIIIFPQTVYYSNDDYGKEQLKISQEIYNKCTDLNIFAREEYSYNLLKEYFPNNKVFLVPDMVLYLDPIRSNFNRNGILLCLRNDREKTQNNDEYIKEHLQFLNEKISYTDTVINHRVNLDNRQIEVNKKIEEFAKSRLVITDRLHGMVFCALSETPCIVILSQSHKVKGVYQWIKNLNYIKLIEKIEDFSNAVDQVLSVKNPKFDNTLLKEKYKPLIEEIHKSEG